MSSKDTVQVSSRIAVLIKELLINLYNGILKTSPLSRSHAAVFSIWALYHKNTLICATVKSAIQCFHFNLLLASYLISQIFLLKSMLKVLWYLYGALLSNKIITLVTKFLLLHFLYIYTSSWWPWRKSQCTEGLMQSQVTSLGTFHSTQGRTVVFLRNLITSLCLSEQETPNWWLYLAPIHRANDWGDFPAMAHKQNPVWSACSRNLPFTERDPLFIVLGLLMYCIFTSIESHLRFTALTSDIISPFLISLLLIVCYSSQLQPASFKCWAPKPSTGASHSSSQHLTSSFSYLKKVLLWPVY